MQNSIEQTNVSVRRKYKYLYLVIFDKNYSIFLNYRNNNNKQQQKQCLKSSFLMGNKKFILFFFFK